MGLIKSSQEEYVRILNSANIGYYYWTLLNMDKGSIWSLNKRNNNDS